MEGDFLDGKRNGMWTAWHANGLKKSEGLYEGGREVGDWYTWKEDGKITTASAPSTAEDVQREWPSR